MPDERITRQKVEEETMLQRAMEKVLNSEALINRICEAISNKVMERFNTELEKCKGEVSDLNIKLEKVQDAMDDLEQYSRKNNLRFFGIPQVPNEDTNIVIRDMLRANLDLELPPHAIDVSHRLPSRQMAADLPSAIIVKFTSGSIKKDIYKNKSKLKGTSIVIREDLTLRRVATYKEAIKKFGNRSVWTNQGKICFKHNNNIIKISKCHELQKYK